MATPLQQKSSVADIRARFDQDVDRFSNLETGQSATIDAPLAMTLITEAAVQATQPIQRVLDLGCGAGNNTLKLRERLGQDFAVDLLDLSQPMLDRAQSRVAQVSQAPICTIQGDFRTVDLNPGYDVILAAAVLHHLRDDADWRAAFEKIYRLLAPGGSVWITDLISHEVASIEAIMWQRYGEYLRSQKGEAYREQVFTYVDQEDSPRPVTYQLDLLKAVGFAQVEILHKNSCFAAFGAVKGH